MTENLFRFIIFFSKLHDSFKENIQTESILCCNLNECLISPHSEGMEGTCIVIACAERQPCDRLSTQFVPTEYLPAE